MKISHKYNVSFLDYLLSNPESFDFMGIPSIMRPHKTRDSDLSILLKDLLILGLNYESKIYSMELCVMISDIYALRFVACENTYVCVKF